MSRPHRHQSEARRRHFVALAVSGMRLDEAAREAKLDPWRALKLVDSPEMIDVLREVRPDLEVTSLREDIHAVQEREAAAVPVGEASGHRAPVDRGVRLRADYGFPDARPVEAA